MIEDDDTGLDFLDNQGLTPFIPMATKSGERQCLARDGEAFLKAGGEITPIADNVLGDPPKKPKSSYGTAPI